MKVEVDHIALHAVLHALIGPEHLIRELQATRRIHPLVPNPIETLLKDYEAWRRGSDDPIGSPPLST